MDRNGKLECKSHCLQKDSFKFFGLQVCVDFKNIAWGYTSIFSTIYIFSEKKKNIEFGLIDMCIVLTVFYCNFRKILHKCNLQCLFFQYGVHCFCGNKIKTSSNCVPDGECNMFCQGNRDELCGGNWKIYIFRNE